MKFKYRVKGRRFEAPILTVGRFIDLQLAFQDLAEAGADPRRIFEAHERLIVLMGNAKCLSKIPYVRLRLLVMAWSRFELGPSEKTDHADPAPDLKPELFSREQLELSAWRTARILGRPVEFMFGMRVRDFNRLSKLAEALWAGFRKDLLSAIDHPHLTSKGRERIQRELMSFYEQLKPDNSSPWREHMNRARKLLVPGGDDHPHTPADSAPRE